MANPLHSRKHRGGLSTGGLVHRPKTTISRYHRSVHRSQIAELRVVEAQKSAGWTDVDLASPREILARPSVRITIAIGLHHDHGDGIIAVWLVLRFISAAATSAAAFP
jgi:hypothetical protein